MRKTLKPKVSRSTLLRKSLRFLRVSTFLFSVLLATYGNAQSREISVSGTVTDMSDVALPGVTIILKGTTKGTTTDFDGNYSLSGIPSDGTLVFSYMGMKTTEVKVDARSTVNVTMEEEAMGLDEVVAIGYGVQKKVNMTGAVSSIKFDEKSASRPVTNVSSALAGLGSGITVRQSVGKPGEDGASINIRGLGTLNNNDPLVIIDGMQGVLDAVNPQDIASISILKDAASASIYGSRAANGVILITTKQGSKEKISVSYNGIFSVAQPTNLLDFVSDYPTYMRLLNESARNIGIQENYSGETIAAWENANRNPNTLNEAGVPNYVAFPNTDWNDVIYNTNLVQNHNISVNGGTKNTRFLLSAGYLDNPGLVDHTGLKRYSMRANVEVDVADWLTVGTRTFGTLSDTGMGSYATVLSYMNQTTPGLYPEYQGKYGFPEAPEEYAQANNLKARLNSVLGENRVTRFNTTLYSKIRLMKGLSWDVNFNYNRRFDDYNYHTNPALTETVKFSTGEMITIPTDPSMLETYYKTYANYNYTIENLLHYDTTIAEKHNINALLGYNETYYNDYWHDGRKRGLINEDIYVFDAATTMLSIGGTETDWALRSWFGRVNYNYDQRYLFEAVLRYDGSSRFDKNTRYGTFPSFAAGWRISEEGFMDNVDFFQNLKLRASWGQLGNNASGDYDYQSLYNTTGYSFGGVQTTGLYSGKVPNSRLQWESTTITNIGLEAAMFDNRLSVEAEWYNKKTDGILTTPPIYLTMGLIDPPTLNTAEVTNKGFELNLGWKDQIGEVGYTVTGTFGYNRNEVTAYKGRLEEGWGTDEDGNEIYESNIGDVSSGTNTRILEGRMIDEHYLLDLYSGNGQHYHDDGSLNIAGGPKDGMIRTPEDLAWVEAMIAEGHQFMPNQSVGENRIWYGDYIYADRNNDGIYGNAYDRRFTNSSAMPKVVFGAQINVNWRNFDLGLLWSGQAGSESYWLENGYNNATSMRVGFGISKMLANNHYYYNADDPGDMANNINAAYPRLKLNENDGQNTQPSTRWLYDTSYLRLKNITLGYTLSAELAAKIKAERVRVYFSAENLLTFTSFPGLDPEMGGNTNYPVIKQIALGTNISF